MSIAGLIYSIHYRCNTMNSDADKEPGRTFYRLPEVIGGRRNWDDRYRWLREPHSRHGCFSDCQKEGNVQTGMVQGLTGSQKSGEKTGREPSP
jgi:hypothetical protein